MTENHGREHNTTDRTFGPISFKVRIHNFAADAKNGIYRAMTDFILLLFAVCRWKNCCLFFRIYPKRKGREINGFSCHSSFHFLHCLCVVSAYGWCFLGLWRSLSSCLYSYLRLSVFPKFAISNQIIQTQTQTMADVWVTSLSEWKRGMREESIFSPSTEPGFSLFQLFSVQSLSYDPMERDWKDPVQRRAMIVRFSSQTRQQ